MVLLGLSGVGVILYVFWWTTVPLGDPRDDRPVELERLARRPGAARRRFRARDLAIGLVLCLLAVLVAHRAGGHVNAGWLFPLLVLLAGVWLAWSQLDSMQRARVLDRTGGRTSGSVLRVGGGLLVALFGVLLLVEHRSSTGELVSEAVAALAVLAGAALVLAPWWLRLGRELGDERAARVREAERADIAAHLHDSVLQTLALIRASADDRDQVVRLARAQERELREWLYTDRAVSGTSIATDVRELVGQIEDAHGVAVEAVVVGDAVPDVAASALLQATREALLNAVRHGAPPVSLYAEVSPHATEMFVRDHGDGFDVAAVQADRLGVRESIVGRITRRGGSATVESRPGWGTEVRMRMPRAATDRDRGSDRPKEPDRQKENTE
jgi:signal transduction histidine kinase